MTDGIVGILSIHWWDRTSSVHTPMKRMTVARTHSRTHACTGRERETDRQTETDRKTGRKKETDRQTDREKETESVKTGVSTTTRKRNGCAC